MTAAITQTFIPGPRLIDGSDLNNLVTQANNGFGEVGLQQAATNTAITTVGAGTLTAAGIVGQLITRSGSTAAFTDTTATAAGIVAAITDPVVGQAFWLTIKNTTAFAETLAGGVGVTLAGNLIIPGLTWARFLVKLTSLTAVAITFVEGGPLIPLPYAKYSTAAIAALSTMAVGGLSGAQIVNLSLTTVNPSGISLPTPAQLFAAVPNASAGLSYALNIRNDSDASNTFHFGGLALTTLTGVTTNQLAGITQNLVVTFNTATDMTIAGMGQSGS